MNKKPAPMSAADLEELRDVITNHCGNAPPDQTLELVAEVERLREALQDARDFVATTLAQIGDGHRIGEIVADWDFLLSRGKAAHDD